jgi:hypothetical protein
MSSPRPLASRLATSACTLALAPLLLLAACAEPGDPSDLEVIESNGDLNQSQFEIYGGSPPSLPEHAATVSLHQLSGSSVYVFPFCSGTLLDANTVITAAHCLDTASSGSPSYQTMAPGALAVYVGDDPTAIGADGNYDVVNHLYFVTDTKILSTYNRFQITGDLGFLTLASSVTEAAPVPNLPSSLGFSAADVGVLALDFVGFGQTETGGSGVKLHAVGTLGGLGCTVPGCPSAGQESTQISYSQGTNGPCFGDSGGPAFVTRDGVAYAAAGTSYGDSNCAVYGVSTRYDAWQWWIDVYEAGCQFSGYVSSGSNATKYHTLGAATTGTVFDRWLRWDNAASNVNFYLQVKHASKNTWSDVASSAASGAGVWEHVAYTVPGTYNNRQFRWKVQRSSSFANYCVQ